MVNPIPSFSLCLSSQILFFFFFFFFFFSELILLPLRRLIFVPLTDGTGQDIRF